MDSGFVEMLETHRLSTARRLFVLEQILSRAKSRSPGDLVVRIRRVMDLDHQSLRRDMIRPDHPHHLPRESPGELDDSSLRAHRQFVDLGRHIIASFPPATAYYLLAPAEQQCSRLRDFAARTKKAEFTLDEPTEPGRTGPFARTNT